MCMLWLLAWCFCGTPKSRRECMYLWLFCLLLRLFSSNWVPLSSLDIRVFALSYYILFYPAFLLDIFSFLKRKWKGMDMGELRCGGVARSRGRRNCSLDVKINRLNLKRKTLSTVKIIFFILLSYNTPQSQPLLSPLLQTCPHFPSPPGPLFFSEKIRSPN